MTTPSEEQARVEALVQELRILSQRTWQPHWPGRAQRAMEWALNYITRTALASRVSTPPRRRGAHSMERIERSNLGAAAWRAYAGDLGHDLGGFRTKAEAKDAIDTWHYFHPEEQRERDRAWVHQFVQFIREANDEGGRDEVERALRHFEARYDLVPAVPVLPTEPRPLLDADGEPTGWAYGPAPARPRPAPSDPKEEQNNV